MSDEPNIVGQVAEFDPSGVPLEQATEEVKQPIADEAVEETETPAELPAESEQSDNQPAPTGEDTGQPVDPELLKQEVTKATAGLRNEIVDLRNKLASATGNERKIVQDQIVVAQDKLDEIDINPADRELVTKILKAEGYVKREEVEKQNYVNTQNQVLNAFLDKYPEYKPENDPDNINWKALTGEYGLYAQPKDPLQIANLLERSHKAIQQVVSDPSLPAKKRAINVASAGAGGTQRSSSSKTLDSQTRAMYERGGWSEEEIKQIEKNLS